MIPQLCLLHFIFLLLIPSSFSSPGPISKPGCLDRCGNIPIPFPFGVGSDCSLGELFNITCNTSITPHKPYFYIFDDLEIVEIKPSQIRVRFKSLLYSVCYNEPVDPNMAVMVPSGYSLYNTPYVFSDENWLTAIGCDDLLAASNMNYTTFVEEPSFGSSCISYCMNSSSSGGVGYCPGNDVGYPSGNGCCVTPFPKGVTQVESQLMNIAGLLRQEKQKLFPCSYAFMQEKVSPDESKFSYPLSYLNDPNEFLEDRWNWKTREPPVVRLDWRVNGAKNCSDAQKNATSYACRDINSECVDYDASVGGYLCVCKHGYQGNPYLTGHGGCQEINECALTNPCGSHSICTNTPPGSFTCSCRKGYYGDGRKNGRGCLPSNLINIFIGVGSALGLVLLLSICFCLWKVFEKRNNRKRKEDLFKHILLQHQTSQDTFGKTRLFTLKELDKATDHFNESRVCGQGGQGIVYKGMLSDGMIVAIKKLKEVGENQVEQFINEIVILSQINHKNVVRLLGCCLATDAPQLVYEFLPNGTLSDLIRDPKVEFMLTWNMRLKIAADVAGAVAYLHSASSVPIYHRDIKSTNILLDEKYVVKVSDFGISKVVEIDHTHLTTRVRGTFGYLDPEYYQTGQYTEKSDVYSFGVVLAELLTGKRPICLERSEMERNLASHFLASMQVSNLDAILDTQISEQGAKKEVIAVAKLARRCLNVKGRMRPTMKEVATELESLRMSQIPLIIDDEPEEALDIEYTWTISDHRIATSSVDAHPLMSQGV